MEYAFEMINVWMV